MHSNYPEEIIRHIVDGIHMYTKYHGYEKLDKVILYKFEPGIITVLLVVNGYEYVLDLDGMDDETEEERQTRKNWLCEDDSIYGDYCEEIEESYSRGEIQEICDEISRNISCDIVTYEEEG